MEQVTKQILRKFGNSELMLSPVGLGCWQFSMGKGAIGKYWPVQEDALTREIIQIHLDGGVNWFDTAEAYGWGASEQITSKMLKELGKMPGDVSIATKWWPFPRTARSIIRTIDERLAALNGFPIDLHQVHQPYSFSGVEAEMRAMAALVKEQKIRYVGVSNFSASQMERAHKALEKEGLALTANQVRYSLLDRRIESNGILDTARRLGVAIIAYSPLAQGLLSGKFHDKPESVASEAGFRRYLPAFKKKGLQKSQPLINQLKELAAKYDAIPAQIALNWLFSYHGETVFVIPGSTKTEQARINAGAMKIDLSPEDMHGLDRASQDFK